MYWWAVRHYHPQKDHISMLRCGNRHSFAGECIGGMIQKHVIRRPQGIFFNVIKGTPGYVHASVDKKVHAKFMDSK
jgi:hypothetical protein